MCGIAGTFRTNSPVTPEDVAAIRKMTDLLVHRGPDGEGVFHDGHVVLGNRRLSIIDLSPLGDQPFANEDQSVWVTFNGEIYNYRSMRAELIGHGHLFRSNTDTEVLVHGYEEWGIGGLLQRIRGMFAFALYDRRGQSPRLLIARDRFGVKPLYYAFDGSRLTFASEVQPLRVSGLVDDQEDQHAYLLFLMFGSVPAPHTTLRSVVTLAPGSYIEAGPGGIRVHRYYALSDLFLQDYGTNGSGTIQDKEDRLRKLFDETIALHLISDAPLGVFLSGGIDSSALVALSSQCRQQLVTLGVVFGERGYSEGPYQEAIVKRFESEHHRIPVTLRDFHDEMESFCEIMDQPTVDGFNTYFVARAARSVGLKAVLSGLGGDEVFCGYPTLKRAATLARLRALPGPVGAPFIRVARRFSSYNKLAFLRHKGSLPLYLVQRGLFTPLQAAGLLGIEEREAWKVIESLEPPEIPRDPVEMQQFLEARHYLVDQLLKDTDVFTMAHSVEVRVPFLDHILVEEVMHTEMAWRFDAEWPKPLLTRPLRDLLPHEIVFRRKRGFTLPMDAWLRASHAIFRNPGSRLSPAFYERVWKDFMAGRVHWSRPWALIVMAKLARN